MDYSYKLIPVFDDVERLEQYLSELEGYSELINIEHSNLIGYSLLKSKKTDLLSSLNTQQRTNLDDFARFLRATYGNDPDTKRFEFQNLTQKPDEEYGSFFNRLKSSYFAIRGLKPPNTITSEDAADLRYHFISRIRNPEVRQKLVLEETPFNELASKARRIDLILSNFNKTRYQTSEYQSDAE